jgi:Ca2+-transporting ATPase
MKIFDNASQGYRTLGMAYKKMNVVQDLKRENVESDLIFLGFVSILDPPRSGVKESVQECQSAGIKVIMITGDHPATAKTIASHVGIFKEGDLVVEGTEIKSLNLEDFNQVSVFSRVNPTNKELIVRNYQNQNKICSMTGDGINDALALKLANAGIAMGITGTDVAKETADMVISDDNFTSIEKGVKIGRGLFSNIRIIIYFFICLNIMESVIFFTYEFVPNFELFASNWQHIYIFGIVHSLPSIALVIDKPPKDVMKEPPRNEEELLNKNVWVLLLIQALFMGIGLVLAIQLTLGGVIQLNSFNINPNLSYIPSGTTASQLVDMKARTMLMTTLYICETTFIWSFRRPNKSIIKSIKEDFSLILFTVCGITLIIHVLIIVFSYPVNMVINDVLNFDLQLNFMFLDGLDWVICILLATPGLIGIELVKTLARRKGIRF